MGVCGGGRWVHGADGFRPSARRGGGSPRGCGASVRVCRFAVGAGISSGAAVGGVRFAAPESESEGARWGRWERGHGGRGICVEEACASEMGGGGCGGRGRTLGGEPSDGGIWDARAGDVL